VGNLRRDLIPSWTKPVQEPEPPSNPRPTPRKVPAAGGDVVMESDVTIPESSQLRGKGKGRADEVGEGRSTRSSSKQKRGFQDSPTKVHPETKRVRKGDEGWEVDLAEVTVDEDSVVDLSHVPRLVGRVSPRVSVLGCPANRRA